MHPASILTDCVLASRNAADADNRQRIAEFGFLKRGQLLFDSSNTGSPDKPPASSPCCKAFDGVACDGRICGDDAIDFVARQGIGNGFDLLAVDVWRDFKCQRHVALMLIG